MKAITQSKSTVKKIFVGISIILVFFVSGLFFNAFAAIPNLEREALIALYNNTDGDNWVFNSGWKTPPLHTDGFAMPGTECTWSGLGCNSENTTVEWIELYYNQLTGSIPPELGNLANLYELDIYDDQLTGSIPPELGNLANLQTLSLIGKLTGSIPPELGNLANLQGLSLSLNELTGSIPPELGNLANLQGLFLFDNQLTGSIPPELGNLVNLQTLQLGSNQLTGRIPSELGNLSNLSLLYLNDNELLGEIPNQLMNLTNLEWLNICTNHLYTNDPDLRDFLNSKQPFWKSCQAPPFSKAVPWIPLLLLGE